MAEASQRAVITAGAAGLGRAMAEALLARGDRVAVCDIDPNAVARVLTELPGVIACQADVTDEAQMAAFLQTAEKELGGVDILCANAGTGGPAGPIEALEYPAWQACISANLDGAFLACRWAAPLMKAQGSGSIILTSSTAGLFGYPMRSPYATAKWGVIGLAKTLAAELGPDGVRVNAICPGAVEGERMDRVVAAEAKARGMSEAEVRDIYVRGVSMRSWVTAGDIADAVLFLTSPLAKMVSGQVLAVDGHTESIT